MHAGYFPGTNATSQRAGLRRPDADFLHCRLRGCIPMMVPSMLLAGHHG